MSFIIVLNILVLRYALFLLCFSLLNWEIFPIHFHIFYIIMLLKFHFICQRLTCFTQYRKTWKRSNQHSHDSVVRSHDGKRLSRSRTNIFDDEEPCLTRRKVSERYEKRNSCDAVNLPSKCGPIGWLILPLKSHRSSVIFDSTSTELRARIRENDNPGKSFYAKEDVQC